jgi:septation ring formation regulator EzrA
VENGFAKVDKRFEQVDKRFDRVEGEMKEGFAQTTSREEMGEVKVQLNRINDRIDRLYYLLLVVMVSLIGALIANGALT